MRFPALVLTICLGTLACGEAATVRLEVDNLTASAPIGALQGAPRSSLLATSSASAPSVFGMKMIAVYLSEDTASGMGNNVGHTPMIYLNPECGGDIVHCDL